MRYTSFAMRKRVKKKTAILLSHAYRDPKYQGKHIIIIGGKIHATKTGMAQVTLLEKLMKKYPKEKPSIAYIPEANTLILFYDC